MSKRTSQLNELIRTITAETILKDLNLDPGIFVMVTHVDVAPDLKNATIFISVLPDNKAASTFLYVSRHLGKIKHILSKKLTIRFIPNLLLKLDTVEREASKIEHILDNLDK